MVLVCNRAAALPRGPERDHRGREVRGALAPALDPRSEAQVFAASTNRCSFHLDPALRKTTLNHFFPTRSAMDALTRNSSWSVDSVAAHSSPSSFTPGRIGFGQLASPSRKEGASPRADATPEGKR